MGKNFTFYVHDDVVEDLHNLESKGHVINQLLRDYLDETPQALQRKIDKLEHDLKLTREKLQRIFDAKIERQKKEALEQEETTKEQEKRILVDGWLELWREGKISDKLYWSAHKDKNVVDLDIIKRHMSKKEA